MLHFRDKNCQNSNTFYMFLIKITIFSAKIQIIQEYFDFNNSQISWLFSLKIQVQNFEFS